jgi:hypothetical protein
MNAIGWYAQIGPPAGQTNQSVVQQSRVGFDLAPQRRNPICYRVENTDRCKIYTTNTLYFITIVILQPGID